MESIVVIPSLFLFGIVWLGKSYQHISANDNVGHNNSGSSCPIGGLLFVMEDIMEAQKVGYERHRKHESSGNAQFPAHIFILFF